LTCETEATVDEALGWETTLTPEEEARLREKDLKRVSFCLNTCPGCKIARKKQRGFWYQAVRASDDKLCPWCASYARVLGKRAYEPITEEDIAAVPELKRAR
jgi:hypothetical protein